VRLSWGVTYSLVSKSDCPKTPQPEEIAAPAPKITMQDIAREVGVTAAAESLALKSHPSISEARRAEIQAVAERMGYRPNAVAAALAHHRHQSRAHPVQAALALINSHPDPAKLHAQPDFELCWRGATKAAEKFGYRLEEFCVNEKAAAQTPGTDLSRPEGAPNLAKVVRSGSP